MKSRINQSGNLDLLRRKAEEISRKSEAGSPESHADDPIGDASWMVHELHVHKIELEMQNEELHRTHEDLEKEHEQYLDLYDFAPVGYCTISEQGQVMATNLTATTMLGMTRNNLVGQHINRFIRDEEQHTFSRNIRQLFATGEAQDCELGMKKSDGTDFWASLKAVLKLDMNIPACRIIISDSSDRKKAEKALAESELHFRNLANCGQALIWTSGVDKLCDYFNEPWLTFTGRTLEQELGNGWLQGVHAEDFDRCMATYVSAFDRREPFSMEYRLRHADGEYRWLVDQGTPRFDSGGAFAGYIGHCLDITSRKHMEEVLLATKKAAESANMAKSAFLANMSHEIRTPLNGLLGMMQLLEFTETNDEQRMYIEMAIRSGGRLTRLLSDILDLSRIEAGRMPLGEQPFSLSETYAAITESFGPLSIQKSLPVRIDVAPDAPSDVFGDEVRVRQVLFNLVGNAMKFCDQGEVRLEVSTLLPMPPDTVRMLFCVSDTGAGMSDTTIETLGSPFTQASNGFSRKHQGAGLGISICKRLVSAMGGTLTFESAPEQGTSAYLMLPFRQREYSMLPDQSAADSVSPSLRILLVEDDETSRVAEMEMLKRMGHSVQTANNGIEALSCMRQNTFDCVLMDVQMEVMDGLEATRKIRTDVSSFFDPTIPIVAMTASAMSGDRERFMMAGMDDYISKPFELNNLTEVLGGIDVNDSK
ncbi:MAG: PAS domain-containing sensor histidine kinase [Deltaproteobacteria bacterium HGW-Deltaproteobacteria-18]|nr:MAG: PAS domain-containing sensor histidine kinase [Deltaproteobacteria bacterium HGW-Deltaproteobacteria-18]